MAAGELRLMKIPRRGTGSLRVLPRPGMNILGPRPRPECLRSAAGFSEGYPGTVRSVGIL